MSNYSWHTPGRTLLHRTRVLTKIVFTITVWALSVAFQSPIFNAAIFAIAFVPFLPAARASWNIIRPYVAVTVILSALFLLVWSLSIAGKSPIASWTLPGTSFALSITSEGMMWGLVAAFRFLAIVFSTFALIVTTFEGDLLRGLLAFRVPFLFVFVLLLATRFVAILSADLKSILDARRSRGLRGRLGLLDVPLQSMSIVMPLLMVSFRRVRTITNAMEVKGFSPRKKRTVYRRLSFSLGQKLLLIASITIIGLVIFLRIHFGWFTLDPYRL